MAAPREQKIIGIGGHTLMATITWEAKKLGLAKGDIAMVSFVDDHIEIRRKEPAKFNPDAVSIKDNTGQFAEDARAFM